MLPLGRQQVHEIITAADIPIPVASEQKDRVYALSNGHPLYLNYLINRMRLCEGEEQLESELQGSTPYEGDIEGTYHSYWEQFQDDGELQRLLGLLARIRGCIDLSWIRTWADVILLLTGWVNGSPITFASSTMLGGISSTTAFVFSFLTRPRSSRQEALTRAGIGVSTPNSLTGARNLHRITRCGSGRNCTIGLPLTSTIEVLELASQGYFRSQLMAFRPMEAIRSDINEALRSVAVRQDPVALVRLCLIGSEMSQRSEYLDQGTLVPLLLRLGQHDVALEYIRSSVRVHGDESVALGAVQLLMEQGLTSEARQVLGIAEPIALLTSSMATGIPGTWGSHGRLRDWIKAAVWFNGADEIVDSIRGLRYEDDALDPWSTGGVASFTGKLICSPMLGWSYCARSGGPIWRACSMLST